MKPYSKKKLAPKLRATIKRLKRIHESGVSTKAKSHIRSAGSSLVKALREIDAIQNKDS